MTVNADLFATDPRTWVIPNDGVSKVGRPSQDNQWEVLRYELTSFVCTGEYERGLQTVLHSYLGKVERSTQPAVWVSGSHGSGKSHLVRVLEQLWADTRFPDGSFARALVSLPAGIDAALTELRRLGRRWGAAAWSVAGGLDTERTDSVNLTVLSLVLHAAGLPKSVAPARLVLWLAEEGLEAAVRERLSAAGHDFDREVATYNLSTPLAAALLAERPDLATGQAELKGQLTNQFPEVKSLDTRDTVDLLNQVLRRVGAGQVPPTLLVLDEVQQFINDNSDRALAVQQLVEAVSSGFGGRVLVVATGQQELTATPGLRKIQDRFSVRIRLGHQDIDTVVRQVALRKNALLLPKLVSVLNRNAGEISRQLGGSTIRHVPADDADLLPDYPLLPSRRRFWERVFQAAGHGPTGQLRSQLRTVHEANRAVADLPVGSVIGADLLYRLKNADLTAAGLLPRQAQQVIAGQRRLPDGELRSRVLQLVALLSLPGLDDTGIRPTCTDLADLLVVDLETDGPRLRQQVPEVLADLARDGLLLQLGDEYRWQTSAGKEWEQDYRRRRADLTDAEVAEARTDLLDSALGTVVPVRYRHGRSEQSRAVVVNRDDSAPVPAQALVVWVRSQWEGVSDKQFEDEVRGLGGDWPVVAIWLPRTDPDGFAGDLRDLLAADRVLAQRQLPAADEGREARAAIQSRRQAAQQRVARRIDEILRGAMLRVGGGGRVDAGDLAGAVKQALARVVGRQFGRFAIADSDSWHSVIAGLKAGAAADALQALGFSGEPLDHPAIKQVLAQVGPDTTGACLEQHFGRAPYGWPPDWIRAITAILLADNHITASHQGRKLTAASVVALEAKFGGASLRRETAVLTAGQKLAARGLLGRLGRPSSNDELILAAAEVVVALQQRAASVSGQRPLPIVTPPAAVAEIARQSGPARVLALLGAKDQLLGLHHRLTELEALLPARLRQWRLGRQLAAHAGEIACAAPALASLTEFGNGRTLLDETDGISPIVQELTAAMREAISTAVRRYEVARVQGLSSLSGHPMWSELTAQQQTQLLDRHGLQPRAVGDLSDPAAVLSALSGQPIGNWTDATHAVQGRIAQLMQAVGGPLPGAVRLPATTLKSEQDIDSYLQALRRQLMAALGESEQVVVTR